MNGLTITLIAIATIILLWIIISFNTLVRLRNDAKKAFAGIDVQLKRRTDLIPNLVETVKSYAKHERQLLESVTKARTSIMNATSHNDVHAMAQGENMLSDALKSIFAVAENYPQLKANENYMKLQEELSETEDQIAASRRIYNENTTYLNTKIETFPSMIIAKIFVDSKQKDLFEAKGSEREKVDVKI